MRQETVYDVLYLDHTNHQQVLAAGLAKTAACNVAICALASLMMSLKRESFEILSKRGSNKADR